MFDRLPGFLLYLYQQKLKNKKPWHIYSNVDASQEEKSNKKKSTPKKKSSKKELNPGSPLGFFIYL